MAMTRTLDNIRRWIYLYISRYTIPNDSYHIDCEKASKDCEIYFDKSPDPLLILKRTDKPFHIKRMICDQYIEKDKRFRKSIFYDAIYFYANFWTRIRYEYMYSSRSEARSEEQKRWKTIVLGSNMNIPYQYRSRRKL